MIELATGRRGNLRGGDNEAELVVVEAVEPGNILDDLLSSPKCAHHSNLFLVKI